jgi:hypothetical protein
MAISLKTAGAWTATNTDFTATLVGTPAAGDRYFLWVSWKDFTLTGTVTGWTKITEFADGSVATGNGTGSMKVACWYKDWVSGDANPFFDLSGAVAAVLGYVMHLWQKDPSETWDTPTFQTGDWPAQGLASSTSAGDSAAIDIKSGSAVSAMIGIRNDTALFTRPATGIDRSSGGAITWNGNYVESPATHMSTTVGNDAAIDLGHRFVTTGGTAVVLNATATLSANETGAILWVHQGVTASGGAATSLSPPRRPNYGSLVQL